MMTYHSLDDFCGSRFWDSNQTWYTDDPDLSRCFQQTVLIWTPCLFLWIFSLLEMYYLVHSKRKNIPFTWKYIAKFILTVILILLSIVDLGMAINRSTYTVIYSVDYCTPLIKILTFILAIILMNYNRKFGMRTSGLLFLFWLLLGICGAVQFRSLIRNPRADSEPDFVPYMIYYPIVLAIFLLNFLVDAEPTFAEYKKDDKPCPEQAASFPSRLTFAWFEPMAWKGSRKPLDNSDLWSLNPEDTASVVVPKFYKYWDKIHKCDNNQSVKYDKAAGSANSTSQKKKVASIIIPLAKAFGPTFLFGAFLKFIEDFMVFINPQLLQLLMTSVHGDEEQVWKGYLYAALFLITALIQTLLMSQYYNRMSIVGMRIRTAVVAAIYRKALRMSNAARKESTVGEMVNLMAVDAQRFMDITTYINSIWSAPLQIILALYFLWYELQWAVFGGLAVMILLIPVNGVIANKIETFQIKQMNSKDERVKLMNEILNGMKVLKLYAWEPSFEAQITKIREKECKVLKSTAYLNASTSFLWSCAPFLVSLVSFATYVFISDENVLDSKKAFVSLSLFNILRFPLYVLPMMISSIIRAAVSVRRINEFMNAEELDPNNVQHDQSELHPLIIENGNFAWDADSSEKPTLRNINIQVANRQLVAIVGTVGSGKSSLVSAFLGEMDRISGRVNTKGSIAYVAQQAWIQNATMQDNILFGKSMDKAFYARVIEACALGLDFKMLPAGDQTEIGEKGINLSGGQKQRVALARAVYSDNDVYFLDDPLSAVDSHVGKHIFENVIGPNGLLKKKTRVLVTHGITYLPEVDNIVVLKDGEITETGTYKQLMEKRGEFADFLIQHIQDVISEDVEEVDLTEIKQQLTRTRSRASSAHSDTISDQLPPNGLFRRQSSTHISQKSLNTQRSGSVKEKDTTAKAGEKIIEVEKTETGSVKLRVYAHYFKSIGWFLSVSAIIMNAVFQAFSIGGNMWLTVWADDNTTEINGTVDPAKRDLYVGVYGALGIGQGIASFFCNLAPVLGCWMAARQMHNVLLRGLMRAPLTFFDTTPTGRIISRISKDIDVLDTSLPQQIAYTIYCGFEVLATLVVVSLSTPIFISVILPIGVIYYFIQRFYVATSRQLKRLESVSRSPVYSHFSESVTGAQTIRAYGVQDRFILESERRVDFNQICYYPGIIANRWLAVRLESVGHLIIFFAALFAVLGRDTLSAGIVGLSVSYALQVTMNLNWLVQLSAEVETNVVAVERVKEYADTTQEAPWEIADTTPKKSWPHEGRVEFRDFKVRYREGLDLILNGLSFTVNGGEKIGIVGRTGAGKSSLTLSLFRIIEAAEGRILIDGIDISKLGLHALRGRLTIIPQDPVLFSGSLRLNLDPFDTCSDAEIWRALELAHLKTFVQSLTNGLLHEVSEGGDNLSVGQRQLVCLARALLRKTKILILDEATAAVDLETDDLIQRTIREEFKECTVLTIAHRLNTILDVDRVIVLDKGCIMEFNSPDLLLQSPTSAFYSMAKDAGLVT